MHTHTHSYTHTHTAFHLYNPVLGATGPAPEAAAAELSRAAGWSATAAPTAAEVTAAAGVSQHELRQGGGGRFFASALLPGSRQWDSALLVSLLWDAAHLLASQPLVATHKVSELFGAGLSSLGACGVPVTAYVQEDGQRGWGAA